MKIYITGLGGSGTTLLLRLFYSFANVFIFNSEISPHDFIMTNQDCDFLIGKRPNPFTPKIWKGFITQIQEGKLKIIYMVRDGRDLLNRGNPKIWFQSIDEFKEYQEWISYTMRYEDLVTHPNSEQEKICKLFGETKIHDFSSYPDFVPDEAFEAPSHTPEKHKARPIDTDRIGIGYEEYKNLGATKERFDEYLKFWGYI